MRTRLLENPGLKIASLIIAFFVWLVISNYSDPLKRQTFEIPIEIQGADEFEEAGIAYSLDDSSSTVMVTVRAKRSVVDNMTTSDLTAVADLTQGINITSAIRSRNGSGTESGAENAEDGDIADSLGTLYVPVTVTSPKVSSDNISVSPINISVHLESIVSKDFVIDIRESDDDDTVSQGYEVESDGKYSATITIQGPESLIDTIDTVTGEYSASGLTENASLPVQVTIRDRNGDRLGTPQLSVLKYVYNKQTLTPSVSSGTLDFGSSLTVDVVICRVVKATLAVEAYGEPADGYKVGETRITPDTIQVKGSESDLNRLAEEDGNVITVRGKSSRASDSEEGSRELDISGRDSDLEASIDLSDFLPEGIELSQTQPAAAVVVIKILADDSRQYEIKTADIVKENTDENFRYLFTDTSIEIRIRTTDSSLPDLGDDEIGASVDLSGLGAGEYDVLVQVSLPEGYELADSVTAKITVSPKTESSPPDSSGTAS